MSMKIQALAFTILFFCQNALRAQIDSAMAVPLVIVNLGGQLPSGDLVNRFGPNFRAGGAFLYKTKKNILFGVESNYLFGRNVKEDVLVQLKTPDGKVTDNQGFPADLRVTERGITIHFTVGKVVRLKNSNANSGLLLMIGAGYLQHKINLYDAQQTIAAIKGDLKKGYDRQTAGPSATAFAGYLNLSENMMLNFYAGIEFYAGQTTSRRKFNYDTGLPDTQSRLDMLTGLRVGWILPLYKKKPNDFYYY